MESLHSGGTLLVDGVPLSYTSEDLKRIFSAYGTVTWARLVSDHMGMSLGFGYVGLTNDVEIDAALAALHGKHLCGRLLKIVRAAPPPLPRRA